MKSYVKKKGSDTWHWCKNCSNYPKGLNVDKSLLRPSNGELCDQCKSKDRDRTCKES